MDEIVSLINDQELAEPLAHVMLRRRMRRSRIAWRHTDQYTKGVVDTWRTTGQRNLDFVILHSLMQKDIDEWQQDIRTRYKRDFRPLVNYVSARLPALKQDAELLAMVRDSARLGMIQGFGRHVAPSVRAITVRQYQSTSVPILIRNVINNESVIRDRMAKNKPWWFMDTGYTNHLEGKKTWHRVTRNGLHVVPDINRHWPADRLSLLKTFPDPWHASGTKILIVESSKHHYELFGDSLEQWRQRVATELDQYDSSLERIWYSKQGKKDRVNVYDLLRQDPRSWYCVISDCSAAAIEAIWLGIPVITLRDHVTTPVARSEIKHIHDLYRGPLGNWLCALTYSQFSKRELENGAAWKILRRHHGA